jgi:hypothetical protein
MSNFVYKRRGCEFANESEIERELLYENILSNFDSCFGSFIYFQVEDDHWVLYVMMNFKRHSRQLLFENEIYYCGNLMSEKSDSQFYKWEENHENLWNKKQYWNFK